MNRPGDAGALALGPFTRKDEARRAVWKALEDGRLHRFPFPIAGRIPNFAGAKDAAQKLCEHPWFLEAKTVKVNPDAPQRYVRQRVLEAGKKLLVPTPRLRDGFHLLVPERIPPDQIPKAASLSHMHRYGEIVPLGEVPKVDLVVTGGVAVDAQGHRVGKGEGYADREYAVLRELGMGPVPVVTTVHDVQFTQGGVPSDPHDVGLDLIVTPRRLFPVEHPKPKPGRIDWSLVSPEELEEMPILRELYANKGGAV